MAHTFIIAEIASSHDGDLVKALMLVAAAADSGVDAVKAEFWSDADALIARRRAYKFAEHYQRYQMPESWLPLLKAVCDSRHVEFMCSTYLPQDIAVVAPFVSRFKIAGFEVHDAAFFTAHHRFQKPIIASLPADVEKPCGHAYANVQWLHCVQEYPCPLNAMQLGRIREHDLDGYSDHTGHESGGFSAVLAGAGIVEAHIRARNTDASNYDAGVHAITAEHFRFYVKCIREAEARVAVNPALPSSMANYRVPACR